LFVISGFLLFGLMSFLAESLSNPVVRKVGGIPHFDGGNFDGQEGEKTQKGTKMLDHS